MMCMEKDFEPLIRVTDEIMASAVENVARTRTLLLIMVINLMGELRSVKD